MKGKYYIILAGALALELLIFAIGFAQQHKESQIDYKIEIERKSVARSQAIWEESLRAALQNLTLQNLHENLQRVGATMEAVGKPELQEQMGELRASLQRLEALPIITIPPLEFNIPPPPSIYPAQVEIPAIPLVEIPRIDVNVSELIDFEEVSDLDQISTLSEKEKLRIYALKALARGNDKEAVPLLEEVVKKEGNSVVRRMAVSIIGRIDDPRIVPILAEVAQKDLDLKVRKRAIYYLGKSRDERAMKVLVDILKN